MDITPKQNPQSNQTSKQEGHEAGPKILENIKFDYVAAHIKTPFNRKPEYKSSDPARQRKIIVLNPKSKIIPESGKTYKVKVIEDTEPTNALAGKYVVDLYFDEAEKEALALELTEKIKNAFTQNKFEETLDQMKALETVLGVDVSLEDPLR